MTGPDTSPTVQSVTEAARDAARTWLHAYGIMTDRYTAGGGDHPAMDTLPAAFEAYAAVQVRAGHDGEVERLKRERDEAFRRHAITEREACDAASRIDQLTRALTQAEETVERMREALRPFGEILKGNLHYQRDDMQLMFGPNNYDLRFACTVGDLRRAAAALADPATDAAGAGAKEIRRQALEEAAAVLDEMGRDYSLRTRGQWVSNEAHTAWRDGATRIRALASTDTEGRD